MIACHFSYKSIEFVIASASEAIQFIAGEYWIASLALAMTAWQDVFQVSIGQN